MTNKEICTAMILMCELKKVCALAEAGEYHQAELDLADCQRMLMELRAGQPDYFKIWNM